MRSFQIVALALMFLFLMAMPAFSDHSSATPGVTLTVGSPILFQSDNFSDPGWTLWEDGGNLYGIWFAFSVDMATVETVVIEFLYEDEDWAQWQVYAQPVAETWYAGDGTHQYGSGQLILTRSNFTMEMNFNNTFRFDLDSPSSANLLYVSFTFYGFPEFTTIQSALDVANTGDTIVVLPGDYTEVLNVVNTVSIIGEAGTEIWMQGGSLALDTFNVTNLTMSNGSVIIANEINGNSLVMNGTSQLSSYSVNFTSTTLSDSAEVIILEYPPGPPNLSIFAVLIGLFVIVGIVITVLGSELEMETVSGLLGGILVLAVVTILIVFL